MADWKGAVPTKQEQREYKQRAMLRTAARIFNRKGFHNTSLEEIAKELGVTKAALYYYVRSKDELLYECLKLTYDCGRRARYLAEEQGGSALERFRTLYRQFMINLMSEHGAYTTASDLQALPEDQQQEFISARRLFDHYSRNLLEEAVKEGALRQVDIRIASNFFIGAINWILRWHSDHEDHSPEEIADLYLDLFLNGLLPSSSRSGPSAT
ncbi:TetR/AcrR family transcriptional regulator [Alloalcanivorax mobilis]|uniref:TetR/AcrR family transcriptional regulator n=1 Tax=Alloalcanivorax mobilis TaxID=2019569 RepID=UPI000C75E292|nr:TetR/AcrR family transcriptional regulator [Alloalcanivorax mobilis]